MIIRQRKGKLTKTKPVRRVGVKRAPISGGKVKKIRKRRRKSGIDPRINPNP